MNEKQMKTWSRCLFVGCWLMIILLPLAGILVWVYPDEFGIIGIVPFGVVEFSQLTWWKKVGGVLLTFIPIAFLVTGFAALSSMFSIYGKGEIFSLQGARYFKTFAKCFFFSTLFSPVVHTLTVLLMTIDFPPGERALSVTLGSHDLESVLFAGVFWVIAHFMTLAHAINEENKEII